MRNTFDHYFKESVQHHIWSWSFQVLEDSVADLLAVSSDVQQALLVNLYGSFVALALDL